MSLKKFGDWNLVLDLARNMSGDVRHASRIALKQVALRAEASAVKHLRNQDLKWRPLDKKYLEWKARKGRSTKIMISTSDMMQSITSDINHAGTVSYAGVTRKARNREGEIIADIAKTMEYGSIVRDIPARPLWRPVFKEMMKFLKETKMLSAETIRQWKKRTGGKG